MFLKIHEPGSLSFHKVEDDFLMWNKRDNADPLKLFVYIICTICKQT